MQICETLQKSENMNDITNAVNPERDKQCLQQY